ncbi:MAG: hypothetical protein EXS05_05740 [Planctomycetaceae bacterium]|nr:hypothetical protein [Planctomycetaceae bacterium]
MSIFRRLSIAVLVLITLGPFSGCAALRSCFGPRDPFAANAPCALPPDATAVQIVQHLNANTARIAAWRSDNVVISGRGSAASPFKVNARLAIEAPRNFRLVASSVVGEEVDFGSNTDQFWFWARQAESKNIIVAYHDEDTLREREFPIPFQPDWIMEALGVMPLDAAEIREEPGPPGSRTVYLISDATSPQGQLVQKVTVVDICHGIVREHQLRDSEGQLIASARMSRHRLDPVSQTVLPRQVDLDWPRANMGLTMFLGTVITNPQRLPEQMWQVPRKEGYPVQELGR